MGDVRLRVGDVVRCECFHDEQRIAFVDDNGIRTSADPSAFPMHEGHFRLLRRPIQPGDVLVCTKGDVHVEGKHCVVERPDEGGLWRGYQREDGPKHEWVMAGSPDLFVHADGTPIEPVGFDPPKVPAPVAIVAVEAKPEKRCETCNDVLRTDRPSKCSGCGVSWIAWSLFRTDPEVVAFVERVSDHVYWPSYELADVSFDKLEETYALAWGRNENGWRAKHMKHAEDMMRVIREGDGPPDDVRRTTHDSTRKDDR